MLILARPDDQEVDAPRPRRLRVRLVCASNNERLARIGGGVGIASVGSTLSNRVGAASSRLQPLAGRPTRLEGGI